MEQGALDDRRSGRERRRPPTHILQLPLPQRALPTQLLRGQRRRRGRTLQPLQRQGAARLPICRHWLLGHFPRPLPPCQPDVAFHEPEDAGGMGQRIQGERIPSRVECPRTSRLHGGQQLSIRSGRRIPEGHTRLRHRDSLGSRQAWCQRRFATQRKRQETMGGIQQAGVCALRQHQGKCCPHIGVCLRRLEHIQAWPGPGQAREGNQGICRTCHELQEPLRQAAQPDARQARRTSTHSSGEMPSQRATAGTTHGAYSTTRRG